MIDVNTASTHAVDDRATPLGGEAGSPTELARLSAAALAEDAAEVDMLVVYGDEVIRAAAKNALLGAGLGGGGGALVARVLAFVADDSAAARRARDDARWSLVDDGDKLLSSMGRWTRRALRPLRRTAERHDALLAAWRKDKADGAGWAGDPDLVDDLAAVGLLRERLGLARLDEDGATKPPRAPWPRVFPSGELAPAPQKSRDALGAAGCARCGCRGWGEELPSFVPNTPLLRYDGWFAERHPDANRDFGDRRPSADPRCGCDSCRDEGCTHVREALEGQHHGCVRCGCAQEFDTWGERTCACDVCHVDGCSTRLSNGVFDLPAYVANGGVDLGLCYDCHGFRSAYDPGPVCPHCGGLADAPMDTRGCGPVYDEPRPCFSCGYEERRELPGLGLMAWGEWQDAVMERDGHYSSYDHAPEWDAAPVGAPRFQPPGHSGARR